MAALSALDSAFLRLEDANTSLHIASVAVLDGPPPSYDEVIALLAEKLPELPRFRQVVREAPLWLGRPSWGDAPDFDLTDHVHRAALPTPGNDALLYELVERLMSTHLDRSRPLWEMWLVEGLSGGRWALVTKVHHCVVDGVGGTQLLAVVLGPWRSPSEVVAARGLKVVSDDGALIAAIDEALAAQPDVLEKIRDGKVQAAGAVIGAVMKAMGGSADAARVRELVLERAAQ